MGASVGKVGVKCREGGLSVGKVEASVGKVGVKCREGGG